MDFLKPLNMLKFFYYCLFYQFYKIYKPTKNGVIEWSALFSITTLQVLNLTTIIIYKGYEINIVIIGFFLTIINYLIFIRNNKYKLIARCFRRHETKRIGYLNLFLTFFYIVLSVKLFSYVFKT
jgi:amino acid permease